MKFYWSLRCASALIRCIKATWSLAVSPNGLRLRTITRLRRRRAILEAHRDSRHCLRDLGVLGMQLRLAVAASRGRSGCDERRKPRETRSPVTEWVEPSKD